MVAVAVALGVMGFGAREAQAQEQGDSAAMAANRGLTLGVGPTLLLPSREDGPVGGGLSLDARYGIRLGPTVVAPGGRLNGYLISSRVIGMAMPTLRLTVPVGPLAPFLVGGLGPGGITNPGETGLAYLGGGGAMIHFGRILAVGGEASYQAITGTDFKSVAIGPSILIGG